MARTNKRGFLDNALTIRWRNFHDRISAFKHYGGFKCACCGEQEFSFLSLDHIDGQGNDDRQALFGSKFIAGHHMYRKLRLLGFPEGFQVLCMNCQVGRRDNGGVCPHQKPCLDPEDLLKEFDNLRVGSGNHTGTLTVEYQTALARVMRKTTAGIPHTQTGNDPPFERHQLGGDMFQLTQYVVVLKTGDRGRIEQWHEASGKYLVEFNRDSSTRQWFDPSELKLAEPNSI